MKKLALASLFAFSSLGAPPVADAKPKSTVSTDMTTLAMSGCERMGPGDVSGCANHVQYSMLRCCSSSRATEITCVDIPDRHDAVASC